MVHSSRRWQKTLPQVGRMYKYDQAYHDMQKKQQDDHEKNHMSSKSEDHSATGNVPNILEKSFAQMEA